MRSNGLRWLLFLVLVTGIALAWYYQDRLDAAALEQWLEGAGLAAPLLFMALYAIGTVLFLPGSVMTLAGGALFGPLEGTLYNLTGATLGAALSFLVARYLASDWVERRSGGILGRLKEGVEREGWRFVAFVRLVPLFPFNLLNYALGLTRIRFSHYLIATYLCMLPGAFAYTWLGYVGREAAAGGEGVVRKALLALALLAAVAFLPRLIARLRLGPSLEIDELRRRLEEDPRLVVLDVRTAGDYAAGHIGGALNVPLEELESRLDELASQQEHPVAIVCTTDHRSRKAAGILAREGFADVQVVAGGMSRWHDRSFPVETGLEPPGPRANHQPEEQP
jgi:Uncharacterized conserved protein